MGIRLGSGCGTVTSNVLFNQQSEAFSVSADKSQQGAAMPHITDLSGKPRQISAVVTVSSQRV